ncbi:hypothetical protein PAMP_019152 [Pampus punctatissimus]
MMLCYNSVVVICGLHTVVSSQGLSQPLSWALSRSSSDNLSHPEVYPGDFGSQYTLITGGTWTAANGNTACIPVIR